MFSWEQGGVGAVSTREPSQLAVPLAGTITALGAYYIFGP